MMHPRRTTRSRSRSAFTLIELLLVVAIIGVLVGVLLPALGKARRSALHSQCASQVRQLALANDLYANDHADRYMPGAPEIQARNLRRWHGVRAQPGAAFAADRGPITPYLQENTAADALRDCPSFAGVLQDLADRGRGFERGCGGYGYNNAYVGVTRRESPLEAGAWIIESDLVGARRAAFASLTRTAAFADAALAADELIEYSFIEPPRWPEASAYRPDPSVHFRHDSRANTAWLDGHVSAETLTLSESSGLYPTDPRSFSLGWFRDHADNQWYDLR